MISKNCDFESLEDLKFSFHTLGNPLKLISNKAGTSQNPKFFLTLLLKSCRIEHIKSLKVVSHDQSVFNDLQL